MTTKQPPRKTKARTRSATKPAGKPTKSATKRASSPAAPPKVRSIKKAAATKQARSEAKRSQKSLTVTERAGRVRSAAKNLKKTASVPRGNTAASISERVTRTASKPAPTTRTGQTTARSGVAEKLATYRSKRDFGKTPEPQGRKGSQWKKKDNPFFVIQKHAASRLHYDFRLEVDGVLKSWAVPKGPSMNPGDKRLAVATEDHPVDYADFEGIIPENEYGGGTVIVWDAGPYRNLKRRGGEEIPMSVCHDKGQIEVWLEGKKIRGGFVLVHSRMGGQEKNWLLIKLKDEEAGSGDPVTEKTHSVMSGRTLEEVASRPRRVWSSR